MIQKYVGKIAVVALIIAIVGLFTPFGKSAVSNTVTKVLGGITNYDRVVVLNLLRLSGVLTKSFTVSTTTPVRVALTNPSGSPDLMCDGNSLAVYTDSQAAFTPSYNFVVGTSTSATDYSATLMASTTAATSTDSVFGKPTGWPFVLSAGSSITLSVGDSQSSISSSTYYTSLAGQISINCWEMGN